MNNKEILQEETGAFSRIFHTQIPLLCMAGQSLYMGWIFCLYWSPAIAVVGSHIDLEMHALRFVMATLMFLSYVVFGLFAKFFASKKGELLLKVLSLVMCPLCCIAGVIPPSLVSAIDLLLWGASGVGTSALLLVWSKKLVELTKKQLIISCSASFMVGGFLFLSTAFMPATISSLAIAIIPIVSVILAFVATSPSLMLFYLPRALENEPGVEDGKEMKSAPLKYETELKEQGDEFDSRQKMIFMRTILLALSYSIGIGFVGSCATSLSYYPNSVYVLAFGNVVAAVFAVLILVRSRQKVELILIEVFLPIMMVCLFLYSVSNYAGQLICLFLVIILLGCHDIIDIAGVSKCALLFDENHVKTFAVGRVLNGFGCLVGWGVGIMLLFCFDNDSYARITICFALVVILVVLVSFAVFHPGPLSYFREVKIEAVKTVKSQLADSPSTNMGAAVSKLARKNQLTARQQEVLFLLAQGRNAAYIAEKFTISNHTAKSHIYNIYNKLNIHSQQELIDLVLSVTDDIR